VELYPAAKAENMVKSFTATRLEAVDVIEMPISLRKGGVTVPINY
jgi:hypothetical protein